MDEIVAIELAPKTKSVVVSIDGDYLDGVIEIKVEYKTSTEEPKTGVFIYLIHGYMGSREIKIVCEQAEDGALIVRTKTELLGERIEK